MREYLKFYIDGQWVDPAEGLKTLDIENPANEEITGRIALGSAADVDRACKAASRAFGAWSSTSSEERVKVLHRILTEYQKRFGDLIFHAANHLFRAHPGVKLIFGEIPEFECRCLQC